MMQLVKTEDWAKRLFGHAQLNDQRLTHRLVQIGCQISEHAGKSIVGSCAGDTAKVEGAYRFIRNERVDAQAIGESGFVATVEQCQKHETILALEDSTTLSYKHAVREQLGHLSGTRDSKNKGFWVHNVLALSAHTEQTIGLLEQSYWIRDPKQYGCSRDRKKRAYTEKESFKWENASRRIAQRLGDKMADVISVCDREADIYDYLYYKQNHSQRFIVRASHNRGVANDYEGLFEQAVHAPVLGYYEVNIPQKGGRKARTAKMELKACAVEMTSPQRLSNTPERIHANLVVAQEVDSDEQQPLRWLLLSSEAIDSYKQARQITRYYELRWRVEDFHKVWKSGGTDVEELRLQQPDHIERMAVIMAFVAVKLLQLRELFDQSRLKESAKIPCDHLLETYEWQTLWLTDKQCALPAQVPSGVWAYHAIGRLGGWIDSKRTGVVGWAALWQGWYRLQDRVEGMKIALSLQETVS